jgi:hypothetical protein
MGDPHARFAFVGVVAALMTLSPRVTLVSRAMTRLPLPERKRARASSSANYPEYRYET